MEKAKEIILNPITISISILLIGVLAIWGFIAMSPKTTVEKGPKVEQSWGNQNSTVTVEVYGDFQCPGCQYFWLNVENQLRENYSDKIKFIYRHYPLSFHVKADEAAEAAEAAGEQGFFFEYANILFENQPSNDNLGLWTDDQLIQYAKEIEGLDIDKFTESFKSDKYKEVIDDYISEGTKRGVSSTPTVYVNNKSIIAPGGGVPDYATLSQEIDAALAQNPLPTTTNDASSIKEEGSQNTNTENSATE